MTMKTTIISSGVMPPALPGALCAQALGIKAFMRHLGRKTPPDDAAPGGSEGRALCHSNRGFLAGGQETPRPCCQRAGADRRAHLAHQLEVEVQVVERVQTRAQNLVAAIEMPQI